ncbi:MAG: FAD:protein FMN transferase [Acidimicrobiia bacterium]
MTVASRAVAVMGSEGEIIVVTDGADALADSLADRAVARLRELEARWSRFLPQSEISRWNAHPGEPVVVSPETYRLVEHALAGRQATGGRFDPTLLAELEAAGYDRSFEQLTPPRSGVVDAASRAPARVATRPEVVLDPIVGSVCLRGGARFDPGGIGKGFAADLVVEELREAGAGGVMVGVGGDVRLDGRAPDGGSWVVAVADPRDPDRERARLYLGSGAVASSWRTKRVFSGPDGAPRHHLLDPRTGTPAESGLAGVTVVTAQGWTAEVLAKAAFVAGPDDGVDVIAAAGAAGLLFTDDGDLRPAGDIAAFLG